MPNWKCPGCDSFNPDTVDQCQYCGNDRSGQSVTVDGRPEGQLATCPGCQGSNPLDRPLCQWCGEKLPQVKPHPEPVAQPEQKPASPPRSDVEGVAVPVPFGPDGRTDPGDDAVVPYMPENQEPKARPCAGCGIMLATEEGIVVAGPRLLCRACFHEEFGSQAREEDHGPDAAEASDPNASQDEPSPELKAKKRF